MDVRLFESRLSILANIILNTTYCVKGFLDSLQLLYSLPDMERLNLHRLGILVRHHKPEPLWVRNSKPIKDVQMPAMYVIVTQRAER